jgi:hypothetical protein
LRNNPAMAESIQNSGQNLNKGAGRGGKRAGAGRPPGAAAVKSQLTAEKIIKHGRITPLEVILETMYACRRKKDTAGALEAAKIAAPYIHARLQAVEMTGRDGKDLTAPAQPVIHLTIKKA